MRPTVSFIVPAFNAEETIGSCLTSIFAQETSTPFEVIVVDNNSMDRTSVLASEMIQVKMVKEPSQGRSYARNSGAHIAQGEFLAFVDADVILDKGWLEAVLIACASSDIGAAQGPIVPSYLSGPESLNRYRLRAASEATSGTFNLLSLTVKESPMINTAACLYRKAAFEEAGGFDPSLIRHEDIDLSRRLLFKGYNLALAPDARAEVIFNGSGWFSYFVRSFEDGFFKTDYLRKWKPWLFRPAEGGLPRSDAAMFMEEVPFNMLRFFTARDSYYLLKAANSILKTLGRLIRSLSFTKREQDPLIPELKKVFVFVNGRREIEFDMDMKVVKRVRT